MINHLSPTQIESFDPTTPFGCNRKWWFDRRLPRSPPDRNLILGTAVHGTLEEFLKGGHQGGLHEIVIRAPGALEFLIGLRKRIRIVEKKIEPGELRIAGVDVTGRIDWVANASEIGVLHLGDHKTTSVIAKYAKTPGQLKKSTQMNIYAATLPVEERLVISQDYYQTKGPKKFELVTVETSKREIDSRIEEIGAIVEQMVTVDRAVKIEEITPNEKACNVGFGCPHRAICPRNGEFNMASLLEMFAPDPTSKPAPEQAALPPDAPKSHPALASQPPKTAASTLQVKTPEEVETTVPRGRPRGSQNKPKDIPSQASTGPVQVERITIRHAVRIAIPNSYGSSNGVEIEATGYVTGSVQEAKDSLSLQVRDMMAKELEIYTVKVPK